MPFAEDLSVFFNDEEFATAALLDGEEVSGIFRNGAVEIEGLASVSPSFLLDSAVAAAAEPDASRLVLGDLVDGTIYCVTEAEPSGTGLTLLRLRRVVRAP